MSVREGRARLLKRLADRVPEARPSTIPRRDPAAPLRLSYGQERLWFLEQFAPGTPVYNVPAARRWRGLLRIAALRAALNGVVQRHESLRTTFAVALPDRLPLQVVAPRLEIELPCVDLSGAPASQREELLAGLLTAEFRQPFDLARGPLVRTLLVRMGEDDHAFAVTLHHTVADGWSMAILFRELTELYRALLYREAPRLPELLVQYADFALWQRDFLRGEELERQLAYWRRALDGAPEILDLPLDRPRPETQAFAGARHPLALPGALAAALKSLSRERGATLFMTLLATFQILLHRYTGATDLVTGSPVANRRRAEIEGLIGYFANTLVLRADLTGSPSFEDFLGRVRAATLGALDHQDVPFEKLVEELRPQRSLSHNPLFQVLFALQNLPGALFDLPEVATGRQPFEPRTAKFDLMLELHDRPEGLIGALESNTDLFESSTIARLAEHFRSLLEAVVRQPEARLAELPLLGAAERLQVLAEWNDTAAAFPEDLCLHDLFAAQARRTPHSVALAGPAGERWAYGELAERAGRLATRLRREGVGPDVPVALCAERSPAQLAGVIAILQAGGACLPLDPAYPAERLAFMLEDSGTRILLAQPDLVGRLPAAGRKVVALETEAGPEMEESALRPLPDNLAYLVFTSGSTGRPKGVAMPHRPLVNLIAWQIRTFAPPAAAPALQLAPLTFDVAFQEIFSTLAAGGTLVLVPERLRRDPEELRALLARERVERLFAPFVALQQLAETDGGERLPLREVFTAGERLQITPALSAWVEGMPGCALHNQYGPSEAHVVTALRLDGPAASWPALPPIGRPIANLRSHLLDGRGNPVPPGIAGELCIGGAGLARGYVGRPDLTAARFVPNPLGASPGGRLYRTGDLARHRPDGQIEFLGRNDQQVKIRGFRVEPEEIEAALARHPRVGQAAVVAQADAGVSRRLVAFLVAAAEPGPPHPDTAELRAHLGRQLPDYMIPSAFVWLEALPRTSSNKVDRLTLARTPAGETELRRFATEFRSPVESMLAEIWADVLGATAVTPEDDFFELGGHSLLATQAVSRIRDVFGIGLPLRTLFEEPTLGRLARAVEQALRAGADDLPPLARRPREGDPPLSFAQQRLWFLDQLLGASPLYNVPARFRLLGRLDVAALQRSLDEIVRRHESIRTTFVSREGKAAQRIAPELSVPLCRVDLGGLAAETAEACALDLAGAEVLVPFDLARGPLLRATLARIGPEDHLLLLTLHHIVSDGWSIGILFRELGALYDAFSAGAPSPLSELPMQYPDFAAWQRDWLRGEALAAELAYWRERLAGLPALALPTDRPRPTVEAVRGAVRTRRLPAALAAGLRGLARQEQATLFMVLLAGFQALLHRYTGQDDLAVGTGIANRRRSETEALIGFFVNTLVLRTDLGGAPAFAELLGRVRDTCLGAYAHEDLPFEKLVDELMPERDPGRNPLCDVMLALQNFPLTPLCLRGLTLQPMRFHSGRAKFDLILFVDVQEAGLLASVEYRTALFDATTVDRLLGHLERLLAGGVAAPAASVAALPLLSEAERHHLLVECGDSRSRYPDRACVHELFAAWAERVPEEIALTYEGEALSYREADRRANRLAHRLLALRGELGAGPGWPVGIYLERSHHFVIAVLAVLKAGGAYVPLDPSHPDHRLGFILRDVGAQVVLTRSAELPKRPPMVGVRVLDLDREPGPGTEAADVSPVSGAIPEGPAQMLYTSGSTGLPKGVAIPHRALVRMVCGAEYLRLGPGDRMAQALNTAFDAAALETWAALLNGAGLVIVPRDVVLSPADLATRTAEAGVTAMVLSTALFNQTARAQPAAFRHLRYLIFGGEAADLGSVRAVLAAGRPENLINAYGPTEGSVIASCRRIESIPEGAISIPIGRPVSNARLLVLDRESRPVPVGVVGELCIAGDGVTIGYLGRPDLTAERYVPDPFGGVPGARLYRTGDLGRHLPGGEIEFTGRADHQVKVRGVRIEPGEIEGVLKQHPEVGDAVVLPRRDDAGNLRLIAYVSPRPAEVQEPDAEWQDQRVSEWQAIYEEIYEQAAPEDPTFNIVGWHSSYTGRPLPADEMREWVEATVARIRSQGARRILEIGCGSGLLLFRLAPHVDSYLATDFSAAVLRGLREQLGRPPFDAVPVRLLRRPAHDFSGIEPGSFDMVVLNSVVQYFPSADYLVRVLQGALRAVAPGGCVFLGDVRSLPHLPAFHAAVQLAQSPGGLPLAQLRHRARQRRAQEQELLVDPSLFLALQQTAPEIGGVDVWLRRGRAANELTRFRYDALVHVAPRRSAAVETWYDWREGWTLESLQETLRERCAPLGLRSLPNARVQGSVELARSLAGAVSGTAEELRRALAAADREGVDPERLWEIAGELGWDAGVTWAAEDPALCDAVFWRRGEIPPAWVPPVRRTQARAWVHYTNNPLQAKMAGRMAPVLRAWLRSRLPESMIPSSFVVLESLPLMAHDKVDRQALAALDQGPSAAAEALAEPRDETEAALAEIWARVLGLEQVGVQDNFFELGGDSILSIQVVAQAREAGLRFTPRQLFEHQTVAALVQATQKAGVQDKSAEDAVVGEVPLTPIQHWFFDRGLPDPHHFNQALLLEVRSPLDPTVLAGALAALARHHDALRLRFEPADAGWRQHYAGEAEWPLARIDLAALPDAVLSQAIEGAAAALQAGLDIVHGPVLRAALFHAGEGRPDRLLLIVHHLVVDGVSWRILLDDLVAGYRQLKAGAAAELPPKTSSFQAWARRLAEHARTPEVRSEADFWLAYGGRPAAPLPVERKGDNTLASERRIAAALSAEETQSLLQDVPTVYNTRINDALLTALLETFAEWTGDGTLELHLEGHGREDLFPDLDLSRTVGWFTCLFPVRLQRPRTDGPGEVLKAVKEQLRSLPAGGLGHGLLRHLAGDDALASRLDEADGAQVAFNYLGQLDSMLPTSSFFARGRESSGPYQSPRGERAHLFEINSVVIGGRLEVTWTYSQNVHREETVRRLAEAFLDHLRALLRHCRSAEVGGYTPSDFPLARLGQEKLDSLLSRLGRPREI